MAQERGPRGEANGGRKPLVTRAETRPVVEHPIARIKDRAVGSIFSDAQYENARRTLRDGEAGEMALRKFVPQADGTETVYEVELRAQNGSRDRIEVELRGEAWKNVLEAISEESIVRANYQGKFSRYPEHATEEDEPIVKEGDELEPGATIGLGQSRKGPFFPYALPKDQFPKGAKLLKMPIEREGTVNPGDVIGFFEALS